jgi:glucan endo-1,6-beta-glucosidase
MMGLLHDRGVAVVASLLAAAAMLSPAHAWLPNDGTRTIVNRDGVSLFGSSGGNDQARSLPSGKLRGVNLGSQFIVEPWMMSGEWANTMGCSGAGSEWDCVKALGQQTANTRFAIHWSSWINETDFNEMVDYGLNAVRVPLGYWMKEDLVRSGEYFPEGGLKALLQLCGWAADRGIYVILEYVGFLSLSIFSIFSLHLRAMGIMPAWDVVFAFPFAALLVVPVPPVPSLTPLYF